MKLLFFVMAVFLIASCGKENMEQMATASEKARIIGGTGECTLYATWNGEYGVDHDCLDDPTNCYSCPPISPLRVIMDGGKRKIRELVASGTFTNLLPNVNKATLDKIKKGSYDLIIDDHYCIILPYDQEVMPLSVSF